MSLKDMRISRNDIKIRRKWSINPVERIVPNKKKEVYDRASFRRELKEELKNYGTDDGSTS